MNTLSKEEKSAWMSVLIANTLRHIKDSDPAEQEKFRLKWLKVAKDHPHNNGTAMQIIKQMGWEE